MSKNSFFGRFLMGATVGIGSALAFRAIVDALNTYTIGNKVALVTGGSRGLGLVIAKKLAAEGAKVVICARDQKELRLASEELAKITRNLLTIKCDITDKSDVRSMIREIESTFGGVDILVNNAGTITVGPMETMEDGDFELAMKVHFWGPYYVMNEVIPSMENKKEGRIVNIVSVGGKVSFPHLLPYNTSKYALSGYSEGMAAELARKNIHVTTVYPGLMQTGSPRNIDVKGDHKKEYAWFKISSSLPMMSLNAERAAKSIVNAMKLGRKTLTLTIPAKMALAIHGIAPDLNISFFDIINRFMPHGLSKEIKKGYESESEYSKGELTEATQEAALQHNER